jgi:hypothetical protein
VADEQRQQQLDVERPRDAFAAHERHDLSRTPHRPTRRSDSRRGEWMSASRDRRVA